jgi:hypothetical protein
LEDDKASGTSAFDAVPFPLRDVKRELHFSKKDFGRSLRVYVRGQVTLALGSQDGIGGDADAESRGTFYARFRDRS